MKIKGWEKINGFTYKGYCIVNPIHNAEETKYEATILNLNLPQKPKWELSVLTPAHKFRTGVDRNSQTFYITMWDENKMVTNSEITKERMKSISIFRNTFEEMVDRVLAIQLTSAPRSSSMQFTGIMNQINQNGITIPYGQIVQSIQSMQQTITNLTNNANNK